MDEIRVLFVIAFSGFQPIEYNVTKKIVEDAGFTVVTASDKLGNAVAKDKSTQAVDIALDTVKLNNYCGVVFIGGPGALDHLDNSTSYKIIQEMVRQNKPVCAICLATRIFAKSGILHGKKATGWNGDGQAPAIFAGEGVHYVAEENVVVDDNIITATGPEAAQQFGEAVVKLLQKKQHWG
jgi:protease I